MNGHPYLIEHRAESSAELRPAAPDDAPPRRRRRTTLRLAVVALAAGVLVAAVAGYDDAVDVLRGERSDRSATGTSAPSTTRPALQPDPRVATELGDVLAAHLAAGEFVGARIALSDADGSVTEVAAGAASSSTGAPVDLDVPWNLGSATKTFVAVVVLQLVDEGRLDLDAGIDRSFPDLADAARITPRMLLQHTSGLNEYIDRPEVQAAKRRRWTADELLAVAEAAGRLGEPGAAHHYANTNYIVLGELIRRVTGQTWDAEVASRITDPLRMHRTGLVTTGADAAIGYAMVDGRLVDATSLADPSIGGAAGGLQSTGRDLLRFVTALEDGSLLSSRSRAAMLSFVPAEDLSRYGIDHGYGLGIEQYRNDRITMIGHMGTGEAQSSYIGYDVEHHRAIAVQTNTATPGPAAVMALESLLALGGADR